MSLTILRQFLPAIQSLQSEEGFTKADLVTEKFLIEKDGDIKIYYAPHNEYINRDAKIIIVGITPGWRQMRTAFEKFVSCLAAHGHLDICLRKTKKAARFAGVMRKNLIAMLDECNLPNVLGIPSSSYLFEETGQLLHSTSMIKYPVFYKDKNYTGHQPPINRSSLLEQYVYDEFPKELAQVSSPALVIPLGRTVDQAIFKLIEEEKLPHHDYLTGFPHPSGTNGHRIKQFKEQRQQLRESVKSWADRINN